MYSLENLLRIILAGISIGSLFGLAGLAYTIVINASQLVNFAQGDFAMFGVAVCWFSLTVLHLPLWASISLGVAGGGLFGLLTHWAIVKPLVRRGSRPFPIMLGAMAMGTIAAGSVGAYTHFWYMPINPFFGPNPLRIEGFSVDSQAVLIIVATVVLVIGYWLFLNKTILGTALRAIGFNREVSTLLGIQTSKMMGLAFLASGVIGAVAGIMAAPLSAFTALDGLILGINGFIAAIIGGWGNPYAAVLGGLTLGLIRSSLTGFFSSTHAEVVTFLVLMIVLTVKPSGLFPGFMSGRKRVK